MGLVVYLTVTPLAWPETESLGNGRWKVDDKVYRKMTQEEVCKQYPWFKNCQSLRLSVVSTESEIVDTDDGPDGSLGGGHK
jgi:hypothetical protein